MSSANSVRGALAWSFAERYAGLFISLSSSMILARLLTPKDIGIYSLCAVVTTLATIVRDFGTSEYLMQEKDLTPEKLRSAFTVTITMAWGIAALVFLSKSLLAKYYKEPALEQVLEILSINFLILPLASPAFALLNREMAFKKIFSIGVTASTAGALTSIVLAIMGFGYFSLAWGSVASTVTQVVLVCHLRPKDSWILPSTKSIGTVVKFGGAFTIARLVEAASRNGHELVIAKQFGFSALGIFNRGNGMIDLLSTAVSSAILRVATPALAANFRSGKSSILPFSNGVAIITGISWPFVIFVAIMAEDIITIMFGSQWASSASIASLLAWISIPFFITSLVPNALAATGQIRKRLSVALWCSPLHLASVIIASFYNLHLVALAFGIGNIVQMAMYMHHAKAALGGTINELFGRSILSAYVAILCGLGLWISVLICSHLNNSAMLRILVASMFTSACWVTGVYLFKHPARHELGTLIKSIRNKLKSQK
jgi:O-antigen/teichoic acid export membrane protein